MSKSEQQYFVLWASGFEEAMATLFITELRRANRRTRLVGLTKRPSSGAFGLALVPDLTLEEALPLASDAGWVVIPCDANGFRTLRADPRLMPFIKVACQAKFITGELSAQDRALFPAIYEQIEVNGQMAQMLAVVRRMIAEG
ncbi:MAG: hypothetical protein AAF629_04855 [Chloroflexota bacterium]